MMRKLRSNRRGSIFIMMYMVVLLLLGFSAAFAVMAINDSMSAERQYLRILAFQLAEAGIERALYDLRMDFLGTTTPSWADGQINTFTIGPSSSYYTIPYSGETPDNTLNGGSYTVQVKNVTGTEDVYVKSTGTFGDSTQSIEVYVSLLDLSPWNNAIFAGAGASGTMINGNVDIRGSVHILGTGLSPGDYAIDIGGTAELVGNNYQGLDPTLAAKVPALETVDYNGETVYSLESELRVKNGIVGLSGSATVGEPDVTGGSPKLKETVDGVYVTDGWGGSQGSGAVYSDNGTSNAYDLGDAVTFPTLSDTSPYDASKTNEQYFRDGALVISSSALASLTPTSVVNINDGSGNKFVMDGSGNLEISGKIVVDGGNNFGISSSGGSDTITYTGKGSLLVTGDAQIDVSLVTSGSGSYPTNIFGLMAAGNIGFDHAHADVMGVFYSEGQIAVAKQTDLMGSIVSNYFDMGTNVPSIFHVPEVAGNLPPGMIGDNVYWYKIVSWQKL